MPVYDFDLCRVEGNLGVQVPTSLFFTVVLQSSLFLSELALFDTKFNYCIAFYDRRMRLKFNELIIFATFLFSSNGSILAFD